MARVNVEQKAITDPRFVVLAKLLGLVDSDHALGKMVRVWNECQERETYLLERAVVDAIFGKEGASKALTNASLAEYQSKRFVYIKGTRGRIEWLTKRREDGKKGGRPRKTLGLTVGFDEKQRPDNPPAPAPAPALIPESITSASSFADERQTPPVLTFPTNGRPDTWHLTASHLAELETLYPDTDILAECRKALAWLKANHHKTARGMPRFLTGWLNRANDRRAPNRKPSNVAEIDAWVNGK